MLKKAKQSITFRLMLFFMIIWSIVSIFVMGVLTVTEQKMAEKIVESQSDRVSYYTAILNADLSRITELLQSICIDEDVSAFLLTRDENFDYQDYEAFRNSYEKLKSYLGTSMYLDDIFLVLPQTQEILRATRGVVSMPENYKEAIFTSLEQQEEVFFSDDGTMLYLNCGVTGAVVGMEVSVRHIKAMLNALNPGYFDCFLVDSEDNSLLDEMQTTKEGRAVYQALSMENTEDMSRRSSIKTEVGTFLYDSVATPGNYFTLYLFAKEDAVYHDLHMIQKIWILLTVFILIIPLLIGYLFHRNLSRPMKKLVSAMNAVENQQWSYRLSEDETTEFAYVFQQYNNMAQRMETLIREVYEKQVQVEQAKRRQLQAQINPHFLYNSFYMGYRMAKSGDSERVASLCMYLGDYFKVMTYVSDAWIPLEQEIKFTDTYLKLNQMRFEEKLEYEIHVETGKKDLKILPLFIQPLVENAIRHGVERVQKPCSIIVDIREEKDILRCSVWDDCGTTDIDIEKQLSELLQSDEIPSKNFGLWNIQNRLLSLGVKEGLQFERKDDGSFRVSFYVPLELTI